MINTFKPSPHSLFAKFVLSVFQQSIEQLRLGHLRFFAIHTPFVLCVNLFGVRQEIFVELVHLLYL